MNTREEFGSYVLLKKLQEDALGETFRAGKMGPQGLERVALLRVFNGEGLDSEQLAQGLEAQRPIQEILKSPNIGSGIDLGRVADVPYVAYDYISGADLASLMVQAAAKRSPIPVDHALLIAERLALGLAVANESRLRNQRIVHGCLLPQLVMLSSEGETRILGFEAGPSLRAQAAGPIGEAVTRYLSPEAASGAPLSRSDDVYSLGVILFELLTGASLPAGIVDISVVETAVRESGRAPLPTGVAALIQKSLAPSHERLPDAATWHKALSKMMVDAQLSPTTFNLAFFMHGLFREEIERESEELEVEKTLTMQSVDGMPSHATRAIPLDLLHTGLRQEKKASGTELEATGSAIAATVVANAPGKRRGLMAAVAIGLIALLGFLYWQFLRPKPATTPATTQIAAVPAQSVPPVAGAGGTLDDPMTEGEGEGEGEGGELLPGEEKPEEVDSLRQQLNAMLDEKTAAMEANLRTEYDQRLRELQRSLAKAQREATAEQERKTALPVATEPESDAAPVLDETTEVDDPSNTEATEAGDATIEKASGDLNATPTEAGGRQGDATTGSLDPKAANTTTSATGTAPPPSEPVSQPEPVVAKPEPVRRGELVTAGPGVIGPKMTRPPVPRFPPMARQLNKKAVVAVRVLVDETGRVTQTELAGKKVGFGFDQAALLAARSAKFEPAMKRGVAVKMWKVLRIKFE